MYVFGGYPTRGTNRFDARHIYVLSLQTLRWDVLETQGEFLIRLSRHSADLTEDKVLCVAGPGHPVHRERALYSYDVVLNEWIWIMRIPSYISHGHSVSHAPDKGVLLIATLVNEQNDCRVYSVRTDGRDWLEIEAKGVAPISGNNLASLYVNEALYCFGVNAGLPSLFRLSLARKAKAAWTQLQGLTNCGGRTRNSTLFHFRGKIILLGGYSENVSRASPRMEVFDPDKNAWIANGIEQTAQYPSIEEFWFHTCVHISKNRFYFLSSFPRKPDTIHDCVLSVS